MSEMHRSRVLIIGSGPAGYTAAIYAARAILQPILVQGIQPGGQMTITTDVENYPGLRRRHPGPLADGADAGAGRACRHADRHRHHRLGRSPAPALRGPGRQRRHLSAAMPLIIATGAQARWLGLPSESSSAASASRPAPPATASSSAARRSPWSAAAIPPSRRRSILTNFASKVTLIHRRDSLRAEKIMQERLFRQPEDRGDLGQRRRGGAGRGRPAGRVTGVRLRNVKTGQLREVAGRRAVRRHRPYAGDRAVPRPARDGRRGLYPDRAGQHGDRRSPASSPPATSRTRSSARR